MALSSEDKKDVARHMGKKMADKVSKVTKDKRGGFDYDGMMRDIYKEFPGLKINGKSPYKPEHTGAKDKALKSKYEVKPRLHSGSVKKPFYKVK